MKFELTQTQVEQLEVLKAKMTKKYGWRGSMEIRFIPTEIGEAVVIMFRIKTKTGKFVKKKFDITDYDSW